MRDPLIFDGSVSLTGRPISRGQPGVVLLAAILTLMLSAGTSAIAIVLRAPATAAPLLVLICCGCPMFAGWNVPAAVAELREKRARECALGRLRKTLADLPETEHPLGF